MGWTRSKTEVEKAEEKLDSELKSLGFSAGLSSSGCDELSETIKSYVRAVVAQEKDDLRDEINKSGMWDPDY